MLCTAQLQHCISRHRCQQECSIQAKNTNLSSIKSNPTLNTRIESTPIQNTNFSSTCSTPTLNTHIESTPIQNTNLSSTLSTPTLNTRIESTPIQNQTNSTADKKKLKIHVNTISARQMFNLARKDKLDIYQCFINLNPEHAISINSIQISKEYTASNTPLDIRGVPLKYSKYSDVFHNKSEAQLPIPPHREYDLSIELDDKKSLPLPGKVYPLSPEQTLALEEFIAKALARGWISPSNSPIAAPCFFVKKPNGELRLCIDYRSINEITKKN